MKKLAPFSEWNGKRLVHMHAANGIADQTASRSRSRNPFRRLSGLWPSGPLVLEHGADYTAQKSQAPGKYQQPEQETHCASEKVHWNQCLPSGALTDIPANRCEGSVCKAKRVSQTKRRDFKRLRDEWDRWSQSLRMQKSVLIT
jgi:hypothetical protein